MHVTATKMAEKVVILSSAHGRESQTRRFKIENLLQSSKEQFRTDNRDFASTPLLWK